MDYSHKNGLFNGTLLVSQENKVIYKKAFGYADFDKKEPLIPESSFYLASVSKQFTSMAVMILAERGELSYENKLSDYFPDFPEYADDVTIRHMMTHTSGIPDHYRLNAYKVGLNNDDVYELLIKQDALDFEPGSRFSYSNGGYVMLAMIVEKVSGKPLHEFMKSNVFKPLGMKNTLVYDQSEPSIAHRAIGYNKSGGLDDYEIFTTGAGGIYSNVGDLFKWEQALHKNKLVPKERLVEAYQPYVLSSGDTSFYGFGWTINPKENWVGHSGGLAGFRTYLRRYPKKGDAFMMLTNNGDALAMGAINRGLVNILSNNDFELPKIPVSTKIASIIERDGIDKAIEKTTRLRKQNAKAFEYDESGINALGYAFLQKEQVDVALKLFKLNIDVMPNSSNTYDSYGEALLIKADTAAAIENYKRSVQMNPENRGGIRVLESLGVDVKDILPDVTLSAAQLDRYVGSYELVPGFILEIIREGTQLYIHPTGQSKSEIFPATESRFYSKVVDAQITFNQGESGNIESLTLHQGGDNEAKKVK